MSTTVACFIGNYIVVTPFSSREVALVSNLNIQSNFNCLKASINLARQPFCLHQPYAAGMGVIKCNLTS